MPYLEVAIDGKLQHETVASLLPNNSAVCVQLDTASVTGDSVYQFAMMFAKHVRQLTSNDRKEALTFDGCRSHISFRVLQHF